MIDRITLLIKHFVLFCGVGLINTVIALAIILILSEGFGQHYIFANFTGYVCGVLIGFLLHRTITFKNDAHRSKIKKEFGWFIGIFILAYSLQLFGLIVFVQYLSVPEWISQILAIGIYTITNYAGNRIFTFQSSEKITK